MFSGIISNPDGEHSTKNFTEQAAAGASSTTTGGFLVMRLMTALLVAVVCGISGCSGPSYFAESEDALDTSGYFHLLDHISAYYPGAISLNFPGYVVGLEEASTKRAHLESGNRRTVLLDISSFVLVCVFQKSRMVTVPTFTCDCLDRNFLCST